ncbi:Retrovirus-related Pol polyprotein from type-1 retrotransposable element R1 [Papilio machaon]|uniref:Retrovirus-related Pol polyprotein from type-1 retrotransposable element R1 n=1 Tax=Papilio machaon TaxID=76193 RepID=A0A194QZG8_PAPMA|nr:Retrovirus-related Pol polyprotein from type-1 retrotransposable element R1 [Papilio machaon]
MRQRPGIRIVQCAANRDPETVVKAAIVLFDDTINVTHCPHLTTCNIAVAKVRTAAWEIGVVSVYLEPNKPIKPYLDQIGSVVDKLGTASVVLGGDLNAWCMDWGSQKTDSRGLEVAETLDVLGLHILNQGSEPTFDTVRGGKRYSSCIDITACTTPLLGRVTNWRTDDGVSSSDHRAILFDINLQKSVGMDIRCSTRKYNTRKANWGEFRSKLAPKWREKGLTTEKVREVTSREGLEEMVGRYVETVVEACGETMPGISQRRRAGLPWWSEELSNLKTEVLRKKRRIRCAAPVRRAWVVQQYVDAKERYLLEVKSAQTRSWKEFCGRQSRETMWEGIYRVIGRTAKRPEDIPLVQDGVALNGEESARMLAEVFFPEDSPREDDAAHTDMRNLAEKVNEGSHNEICDPPFTRHELMWAASSFNPKKAPGPDGLTADICLVAITLDPELFLEIANRCLALACFPRRWKEAAVVVLRKPNKENYTHPKAYRPIGLLPIMGKILEKMLVRRVRWHTAPMISRRQYGFMPQRGTEDSLYDMIQHIRAEVERRKLVVLVSLDIEGAFDNAWWPAVRCSLAATRCPVNLRRLFDHYFSERIVRVRYAGAEWTRRPTKGCVQGSIGGPTLWNLLLNPLLVELEDMGIHCQAFADDVVLMFSGDSSTEIQGGANAALDHVRKWGVRNKLNFAPQKTKAMVITRKIKYDSPRLNMGGRSIELTKCMKILGLTVDDRLTFNAHIRAVCTKALSLHRQLSTAAKISWGLNPEIIRTIYVAVVEPIILYAASVWAPAARKKTTQKLLDRVQRGFAQKIVRAYRTVSLNAPLIAHYPLRGQFGIFKKSTMRTRVPRCRPFSTRILAIFLLLLGLALYCIYYNATPSGYNKPKHNEDQGAPLQTFLHPDSGHLLTVAWSGSLLHLL